MRPVIETGSAQMFVVYGKAQRLYEMQARTRTRAQSCNVAGVRRNLGMIQYDVQHDSSVRETRRRITLPTLRTKKKRPGRKHGRHKRRRTKTRPNKKQDIKKTSGPASAGSPFEPVPPPAGRLFSAAYCRPPQYRLMNRKITAAERSAACSSMMSVGRSLLDIGKGADHRNDADEKEKVVHDSLLCL